LFISPFILVFAFSVFFLVHAWLPKAGPASMRVVPGLALPPDLDRLSGRARIDALKPLLHAAGVEGEVGWIEHNVKRNLLILPVSVPGRLTRVTIDTTKGEASIEERKTGLADALVTLHKSPGPHLEAIRMNWFYMRAWRWLADGTVYLIVFLTMSGVYLWYALRAERRIGITLIAAGAVTFFTMLYALVH
jgi:hypothetical protein